MAVRHMLAGIVILLTTAFVGRANGGPNCVASNFEGYQCSRQVDGPKYVVHWLATHTYVSIAIVVETTGWVALGWSPTGDMLGDAIIGNTDTSELLTYLLGGDGMQPSMAFNVSETSVEGRETKTILRFTRSFADGGSVPILAEGNNTMIWSYSMSGSKTFANHGPMNRGSFKLDFASLPGESGSAYGSGDGVGAPGPDGAGDGSGNGEEPYKGKPGSLEDNGNGDGNGGGGGGAPGPSQADSGSLEQGVGGGGGCFPSTLAGYLCSVKGTGGRSVTLHWNPPTSGDISLALEVATTGWVGLGWSTDGTMEGSDAVIASTTSDRFTAPFAAATYYLGGETRESVEPTTSFRTTNALVEQFGGTVTLRFIRTVGDGGVVPVSTGKNVLIWATGDSGGLANHGPTNRGTFTVDFSTGSGSADESESVARGLYNLHGWLLWLGFGVLMPLGLIAARLGAVPRLDPQWFYAHIALQTFGWVALTAGVLISLTKFKALDTVHAKVGLAAAASAWVQPFIGLARPKKGEDSRPLWFAIHWSLGTFAVGLGWAAIFYGLQAYGELWAQSMHIWVTLFSIQAAVLAYAYLLAGNVHKLFPSKAPMGWMEGATRVASRPPPSDHMNGSARRSFLGRESMNKDSGELSVGGGTYSPPV